MGGGQGLEMKGCRMVSVWPEGGLQGSPAGQAPCAGQPGECCCRVPSRRGMQTHFRKVLLMAGGLCSSGRGAAALRESASCTWADQWPCQDG